MPKYNDFELDLQKVVIDDGNIIKPKTRFNCDFELTIRPCQTDYYICIPKTMDHKCNIHL